LVKLLLRWWKSPITYAIFYVQVPLWLKFLQFLWWWINHSLHISTMFQIIVIIILVSSVCVIKFLQFLLIKYQNQRFYKSKEPVSEVPSNTEFQNWTRSSIKHWKSFRTGPEVPSKPKKVSQLRMKVPF
jgi:hypothetical protein